jgi:hypothetical protein
MIAGFFWAIGQVLKGTEWLIKWAWRRYHDEDRPARPSHGRLTSKRPDVADLWVNRAEDR